MPVSPQREWVHWAARRVCIKGLDVMPTGSSDTTQTWHRLVRVMTSEAGGEDPRALFMDNEPSFGSNSVRQINKSSSSCNLSL